MATARPQDESGSPKAESRRDRYERGLREIRSKNEASEVEEFDWFSKREAGSRTPMENIQVAGEKISNVERKSRMLHNISRACRSCSMCDLGLELVGRNDIFRDPHIFSNSSVSKVMLVCRSPDWDSLSRGETFYGSRDKFDKELKKYDLSYHDFYICSILRCHSDNTPTDEYVSKCRPFLQMEVNLLQPRLMIAMGQFVFDELCKGASFNSSLNSLAINSYGIKTISMHETNHPDFDNQIKKIAKLVAKII